MTTELGGGTLLTLLAGPIDESKGAYVDWARVCARAIQPAQVGAFAKLVVATLYGYTFLPATAETAGVAEQANDVLNTDGTLEDLVAEIVAISPTVPLDTLLPNKAGGTSGGQG